MKKLKIAIICGGPSGERGISLNSARSVCDHLLLDGTEIIPFYLDLNKKPYLLSQAQLYSNTPSDFDFKLKNTAKPLSKLEFEKRLKKADIVFPVIHGEYGEDGGIQSFLEKINVPYVGSSSNACKKAFDKFTANEIIREAGFYAPRTLFLKKGEKGVAAKISKFWKEEKIKKAVLKPSNGGSSLGVVSVFSAKEAEKAFNNFIKIGQYSSFVLEPFCEGVEFTTIILENKFGLPVSLMPIEIETDYKDGTEIFDYRKKYLATNSVSYHIPTRFSEEQNKRISIEAEQIFSLFGMKGFARFDGWILNDGSIWFSDFNPISGMEQNSFLFIAASRAGMTHSDVLKYIVGNEARKNKIKLPDTFSNQSLSPKSKRKTVNVIFGGQTSERQVSLMSGTNVWLKLRNSKIYQPIPHFLDVKGSVWKLPYRYALNHTVEEVLRSCEDSEKIKSKSNLYTSEIKQRLFVDESCLNEGNEEPLKLTLKQFVDSSDLVFNTIHGGIGEDGTLQKMFENRLGKTPVVFNGAGSASAKLCMDKFRTGQIVTSLRIKGIRTAQKQLINFTDLAKANSSSQWKKLISELGTKTLIVKPPADGCSSGIVRLYNAKDLKTYVNCLKNNYRFLAPNTLTNQTEIVELPISVPKHLLFEEFIETDRISINGSKLKWTRVNDWVEVTVGVLGKKGQLRALNPSITVATGNVLSLEEKFQGGTGVNITPPPEDHVPKNIVSKVKEKISIVANALEISGYARIDAFINIKTAEVIIIEANILPGLTGSTVIFHQALEEKPAMYPREFLEEIIRLSS